jgi:acyl carrier protein
MSTDAILTALRAYVKDNFLYMRSDLAFGDEDSLLARGIIDSLGVMELVGFVEERFGLAVEPDDITAEHFGTLGAIARYVARRQAESGASAAG